MNTKNTNRFLEYVATVFLAWGLLAGVVSADTYTVNASVPYKAPDQAAVMQTPVDGASFENAPLQVSGTCQMQNPPYSISIVRDGAILGSTACTDGTFSVPVTLAVGQNRLLARTINVNGVYGPDSSLVTVTLKTPTVVTSLPIGSLVPTTQDRTAVTNQGALVGLVVTSQGPSSVLEDTKTANVQIVVAGGQQPYTIQLQWGDGSTEARTVDTAGTYHFRHVYGVQKNFNLKVYVRDVVGAFAQFSYAVISTKKTGTTTLAGGTQPTNGVSDYRWVWYGLVVFFLILIPLAYILGYRRGYGRSKRSKMIKSRNLRKKKPSKARKPLRRSS